jgi:hypothetical protein
MNRYPSEPDSNPDKAQLDIMIRRAADGELSEQEKAGLMQELKKYPDLEKLYRQISAMPDLAKAYPVLNSSTHSTKIDTLMEHIDRMEIPQSVFSDVTFIWFKKYALAASILIMAVTSLFYVNRTDQPDSGDISINELFYGQEEPEAESYVLYLEELFQ